MQIFNRKMHWQNIYQNRSPLEVSWYQKEPVLSLEFIRRAKISIDEEIIDIGGGASVLVDRLCREGYRKLAVLDISGSALAGAQERLGDAGKSIEWFETDITEFETPHMFSLWHDRAVFHFLTEQSERKSYVKVLKQALRRGGHFIIAAFAIGGPVKCSGLEIVQYDAGKLIAELGDDFELLEERNEVHITPGNSEQKFQYFHFLFQHPENLA